MRAEGQLVFNTTALMLQAALDGFGLAYLTEQQVQPYLDSGKLARVLANWCPHFPGYYLYYPSRRQPSAAFAVLVDALRYRGLRAQKSLFRHLCVATASSSRRGARSYKVRTGKGTLAADRDDPEHRPGRAVRKSTDES